MSGAMGIPARSLSSRIPPDALTGNNPNGRRLLAEMWRPTPRSLLRKAGANIAELRRILLFRTSAAGDSFCASDCPVRKQSSANHFESRTGSATAPYRPMIANPSPLNRHRKRTTRPRGRAQFASPARSLPGQNRDKSLTHGILAHSLKLYSKFESNSLRQQVSTAEKRCGFPLKIAENPRNFASFALKPDSEKVSCWTQKASSAAHFSGGLKGSPVRRNPSGECKARVSMPAPVTTKREKAIPLAGRRR